MNKQVAEFVGTFALVFFGCGAAMIGGMGPGPTSEAQAQESRTFVIPETAGYGVDECLEDNGECGATVANAWCNTYGQGVALEFGRYGVDKSSASNKSWPAPKRYYVDCSLTEPH